jgi:hypothetical protein
LDIGYAIAELSKFSNRPTTAYYAAVKCVFPKPLDTLPYVQFPHICPLGEVDHQMHMTSSIAVLCQYLYSAYDNCLRTYMYVGAQVFCLAGTAIEYRSKRIAVVCLSSTECDFVTAVGSAKVTKFLHAILCEISIRKLDATELYEEVVNAKRPTGSIRHIDIQKCALQEWVTKGEVILHHIWVIIIPDDALIKDIGWLLHHRNSTHVVGVCGSPYSNTSGRIG